MFYNKHVYQNPQFWVGVKEFSTVALGIGAWGLMAGVAVVKMGLNIWVACILSLTVFAGSAQLAVVPLMVSGAPIWVIWATAFCVNLRFVVFSAHLRPYTMHLPFTERLQVGYLTGDLSYVFFMKRYPKPGRSRAELDDQQAYLTGSCAANFITWHVCSLVGIALAHIIPPSWGLGFAGTLALLGILVALITTRMRLLALCVASGAAIMAFALPLKLHILTAIAITVLICLAAERLLSAAANSEKI